jgi:hypothetical protein
MDEKGCRIACPSGEEVVVPIGIKEMYVGVPENRLPVTVVEHFCGRQLSLLSDCAWQEYHGVLVQ